MHLPLVPPACKPSAISSPAVGPLFQASQQARPPLLAPRLTHTGDHTGDDGSIGRDLSRLRIRAAQGLRDRGASRRHQGPGRMSDSSPIVFPVSANAGRDVRQTINAAMSLLQRLKLWGGPAKAPLHLRHGAEGEQAARDYLKKHGLKFLTANFRSDRGEIDLVFSLNCDCFSCVRGGKNSVHRGMDSPRRRR